MGFETFVIVDRELLLAHDQGMEHGPTDFDRGMVDRSFFMNLFKTAPVLRILIDEPRPVDEALRA